MTIKCKVKLIDDSYDRRFVVKYKIKKQDIFYETITIVNYYDDNILDLNHYYKEICSRLKDIESFKEEVKEMIIEDIIIRRKEEIKDNDTHKTKRDVKKLIKNIKFEFDIEM